VRQPLGAIKDALYIKDGQQKKTMTMLELGRKRLVAEEPCGLPTRQSTDLSKRFRKDFTISCVSLADLSIPDATNHYVRCHHKVLHQTIGLRAIPSSSTNTPLSINPAKGLTCSPMLLRYSMHCWTDLPTLKKHFARTTITRFVTAGNGHSPVIGHITT
jgi:hypothetical protein